MKFRNSLNFYLKLYYTHTQTEIIHSFICTTANNQLLVLVYTLWFQLQRCRSTKLSAANDFSPPGNKAVNIYALDSCINVRKNKDFMQLCNTLKNDWFDITIDRLIANRMRIIKSIEHISSLKAARFTTLSFSWQKVVYRTLLFVR